MGSLSCRCLRRPCLQLPQRLTRRFAMRLPMPDYRFEREVPKDLEPIPIAIVGRPNVGKSTLFNQLQSGTRKQKKRSPVDNRAIVSDRAGTTRDRKDALAVLGGLLLRVIDTGGLESPQVTSENSLLQAMQDQVWRAVAEARAILFVIDAQEGITPSDLQIAQMLRDSRNADKYRDLFNPNTPKDVPIILIANKAEGAFIGPYLNDCYDLGVGDPVIMSAMRNQGTEELLDRLYLEVGHLQAREEVPHPGTAFMPDERRRDIFIEGEEAEEEELEEDEEEEELDEDEEEAAGPTLPWLSLSHMTEHQRNSLRFLAHHPADPLGDLDPGLKAAVMHVDPGKYWLQAPQRSLPTKEARDFVLKHRRAEEMDQAMKLAVIGQPSAGKSSIINALLQEERCIVNEQDGTTMDSIITNWTFKENAVKLIDTCGISRGWRYPGTDPDFLEPGMGTKKAIRRAHVCVLCLDAAKYQRMTSYSCPTKFEVRLGNYVAEEGKCLIIASASAAARCGARGLQLAFEFYRRQRASSSELTGGKAMRGVRSESPEDVGDGWRVLHLSACCMAEEEQAVETFARITETSSVVAAVLLDPEGDAAGRFGHPGACRAMATMMSRHRLKRRRGPGGRRRRRGILHEAWTSPSGATAKLPEKPLDTVKMADFFEGRSQERLDLSNWMAALPEQLPVSQVSMPGTHDSATFQMWPLPVSWEYVRAFGQTQDWDLPTQLAAGVRFLDLRVKGDGWLYHGPLACSLTLEAALQCCAHFLQQHDKEFIVLRIKDEERSRTSVQKVPDLIMRLAKYLPLHFSEDLQLVGDLRGRMLVLSDFEQGPQCLRWAGPSMKVQDFWSPGSPKEKWVAIVKHMRGAPRRQGDRLCANFLSAQSFPRRTPRYFAGILNAKFCATISRSKRNALGIVVMDFPSRELCAEIVHTNFLQSKVAASRVHHALDGWGEDYTALLREVDAAALAADGEDYVQKLSSVYARLLVQRSQFVIVSEQIRAQCQSRQVPSELHLTASQISRIWEKEMQRTKRKVREVAKTRSSPNLPTSDTSPEHGKSRPRRATVQLFRGEASPAVPTPKSLPATAGRSFL
ncbi:unnamed protein product [Effrenium voratum]|nr:unnamed protein product [Effrenium voratum]